MDNSKLIEQNEELKLELENAKNQLDAVILKHDQQWNTDGDLNDKISKVDDLLTASMQKLIALDNSTIDVKVEQLLENLTVSNNNYASLMKERNQLQADFDAFKEKSANAVDLLNQKVASVEQELEQVEEKNKELMEGNKSTPVLVSETITLERKNFTSSQKSLVEITPPVQRKKLRQVTDSVFDTGITLASSELRRVSKRVDRGSTEINRQMVQHRSSSSHSGSLRQRSRIGSANQGQVIVSFSSKLVQYRRKVLNIYYLDYIKVKTFNKNCSELSKCKQKSHKYIAQSLSIDDKYIKTNDLKITAFGFWIIKVLNNPYIYIFICSVVMLSVDITTQDEIIYF